MRTAGSFWCSATHSVETRTSGFAYSAINICSSGGCRKAPLDRSGCSEGLQRPAVGPLPDRRPAGWQRRHGAGLMNTVPMGYHALEVVVAHLKRPTAHAPCPAESMSFRNTDG